MRTLVPIAAAALLGLGAQRGARTWPRSCAPASSSVDEGQCEAVERARHVAEADAAPRRAAAGDAGDRAADGQRDDLDAQDDLARRRSSRTTNWFFQTTVIGQRTFNPFPMLIMASIWYLALTSVLMIGPVLHRAALREGRGAQPAADSAAETHEALPHGEGDDMTTPEASPATSTTPMVKAENVHKSFGRIEVLKGIDLEVAPREVMCSSGPPVPASRRSCGASTTSRRSTPAGCRSTASSSGYQERGEQAARDEGERGRPPTPRHRHGVPAFQPLPAHDGRRQRHGGTRPGQRPQQKGGQGAGPAAARPRRPRRPVCHVPDAALGRSAAAGGDRPGAGDGAQADAVRRADQRPRPRARRRGARRDARPGQERHDDDRRDARDGLRARGRRLAGVHGPTGSSSSPAPPARSWPTRSTSAPARSCPRCCDVGPPRVRHPVADRRTRPHRCSGA